MNDSLYHVLLVGLGLIFATSLAMLVLYRPKPAGATAGEVMGLAPAVVVKPIDPRASSLVQWKHPANHAVLKALHARRTADSIADQAAGDDTMPPGAHPDITAYVYGTLRDQLPETCRWVVYGRPVLVHPRSGIVFAFGIGSECVALRLPIDGRGPGWSDECPMEDDCLSIDEIGADWAFMRDAAESGDTLAAYEHAAWL